MGKVVQLVLAGQTAGQAIDFKTFDINGKVIMLSPPEIILPGSNNTHVLAFCSLLYNLCNLGHLPADNYGHACFKNPRFLCGNFCEAVAKMFTVVKTYRRYQAQQRIDNVGSIESSAKPGFNNGNINPMFPEAQQSHCRSCFKKGHRAIVCCFAHHLCQVDYLIP